MKIFSLMLFSFYFTTTQSIYSQEVQPSRLKPNFEDNLNTFYTLVIILFILIFAVNILAVTIRNLMATSKFMSLPHTERVSKVGTVLSLFNKGITVLVLMILVLYSTISFRLNFTLPGSAEKMPWLQVHKSDIYFFLGVILVLFAMVIFLTFVLNKLFRLIYQKGEIKN